MSNVHSSTIHNSQDLEATRMSNDRGTDKEEHITKGILLNHKNELNNAICSNIVDLGGLPGGITGKKKICLPIQEMWVQCMGWEEPLE